MLCLLGVLFIIGGYEEAFTLLTLNLLAVLVAAEVVCGVLSLSLLLSSIAAHQGPGEEDLLQ